MRRHNATTNYLVGAMATFMLSVLWPNDITALLFYAWFIIGLVVVSMSKDRIIE